MMSRVTPKGTGRGRFNIERLGAFVDQARPLVLLYSEVTLNLLDCNRLDHLCKVSPSRNMGSTSSACSANS
jgi:hypothetical protein